MSWNLNEQEIVYATVYTQHCAQELLDEVDFSFPITFIWAYILCNVTIYLEWQEFVSRMLCSYAVVVVLCSHHQSILVEVFNALNVLQNVLQIRILAGCMLFIACLLHNFLILLRTVRMSEYDSTLIVTLGWGFWAFSWYAHYS